MRKVLVRAEGSGEPGPEVHADGEMEVNLRHQARPEKELKTSFKKSRMAQEFLNHGGYRVPVDSAFLEQCIGRFRLLRLRN